MDESVRQALLLRNERIIGAVLQRAERECPGALELLAVTGSFAGGDFYENSDLDLLIVIGDPAGYRLAKCFILGDVAHDLYCQTWEQLERMAAYPDPHVLKLLDVQRIYAADGARQRYGEMRRRLTEHLAAPLTEADLAKICGHYRGALASLGRMHLAETDGECRYHAAGVLLGAEYAVYMGNHAVIRHGIRGIPAEIASLSDLPADFAVHHRALTEAGDAESLCRAAKALLASTGAWIGEIKRRVSPPRPASAADLCGTYEEVWSNWKNKMHRAAAENDAYLSRMTAASCQAFYEEMAAAYDIRRGDLFAEADTDLHRAAQRFDEAMEQYRTAYDLCGAAVCRYADTDEFVRAYAGE